ncbi:MAG TPA: hypothetical protein VJC05_02890, partial [Candidatus Andersenbacteria bacterium]|nr:hypothetical protein [Candidatus Andersenbacteria bacterium]
PVRVPRALAKRRSVVSAPSNRSFQTKKTLGEEVSPVLIFFSRFFFSVRKLQLKIRALIFLPQEFLVTR